MRASDFRVSLRRRLVAGLLILAALGGTLCAPRYPVLAQVSEAEDPPPPLSFQSRPVTVEILGRIEPLKEFSCREVDAEGGIASSTLCRFIDAGLWIKQDLRFDLIQVRILDKYLPFLDSLACP